MPQTPVTALLPLQTEARNDYLRIGLLLSVCIHAVVLTVHFTAPAPPRPLQSDLEITLVNARTEVPPSQPRVLAQDPLRGGGEAAAGRASSPLPRTSELTSEQAVLASLRKRQHELEQEQQRLLTQLQSLEHVAATARKLNDPEERSDPGEDAEDQESIILNAQISAIKERIERYNAMPQQMFEAPSAAAVDYAQYVEAWRKKIELLGTEHYPAEARGKLYGSLQLTVYIKKNGEIARVEIDRPSNHAALNLAAHRIVQLAAPFAPLPPAIAGRTDVLAITRTWHFVNNQLQTGPP